MEGLTDGVIDLAHLRSLSTLSPSQLPSEFRIFKFGENESSKGTYVLDEAGAQSVMAAYQKRGIELAIDYEHQTFESDRNGQAAPAAGWFVPEVRADGVWATNVRWTPRASELLANREYRYFSPVFAYDGKKRITELLPSALTNFPATRNQQSLVAAKDGIAALSVWSTATINDLPDSSFLHIEAGGTKDGEGKTTPRSLRHFPVRDASGSIDMPHLRNALARIPQSSLPAAVKAHAAAEAERLMQQHRPMEKMNMANGIAQVIGLKDDATEDAVSERVIALAGIERRILEATGANSFADAMTVVLSNKDAASERDRYKQMCREWQERHDREATDDKRKQIDGIIHAAILEGRVGLKDDERIQRWRKHGEEYGPEQLAKLVAERDPRPVRQFQMAPPENTDEARMRAVEDYKKANPNASTADAYVACSAKYPALFSQEVR